MPFAIRPSKLFAAGFLAAFTSACAQTSITESVVTDFAVPNATGNINEGLSRTNEQFFIDADGDGYAYQSGVRSGKGLAVYSGLVAGTDVNGPPPAQDASYSGRWSMLQISDINYTGTQVSGNVLHRGGPVTLVVNGTDGTLTTQGPITTAGINIRGDITGNTLIGTVSINGIFLPAEMNGLVGADKAIGAFHGGSAIGGDAYAGGFYALPD